MLFKSDMSQTQRLMAFCKYLALLKWDAMRWKTRLHKPYQMLLYRFRSQKSDVTGQWLIRSDSNVGGKTNATFDIVKNDDNQSKLYEEKTYFINIITFTFRHWCLSGNH